MHRVVFKIWERICVSVALVLAALLLAVAVLGCNPEASDTEIKLMCERLTVLRRSEDDRKMLRQCVLEAQREGVSKRQAQCRIEASNKLEYWNRCRTGAPRSGVK